MVENEQTGIAGLVVDPLVAIPVCRDERRIDYAGASKTVGQHKRLDMLLQSGLIVRLVRLAIQEIAQYWLSHRLWLASHCRFPAQLTLRCFLATTAYAFLSLSLHRVAPDRRRQLSGCSEN
jgi:hypothetical protein